MADAMAVAYTVIFIGVLLMVGLIIFGYVSNQAGDPFHAREIIIPAGCGNSTVCEACENAFNTSESANCTGVVANPPIENVTRAIPVVLNCSGNGSYCQTMTVSTDFNYSVGDGRFHVLQDLWNGNITVDYFEDEWADAQDNAQQSVTSTGAAGFELAAVIVIVMAAVAVVSTIYLAGTRGA